jgi:hypothetical protein
VCTERAVCSDATCSRSAFIVADGAQGWTNAPISASAPKFMAVKEVIRATSGPERGDSDPAAIWMPPGRRAFKVGLIPVDGADRGAMRKSDSSQSGAS